MKLAALAMLLACAAASLAAQPPSSRTDALPRFAFKPQVNDYYPPTSLHLNEQGTTELKLCYDERGMPRDVTVHESSGFPKLDRAAVLWGKAVRVKPAVANGEPVPGCARVPVKFPSEKSGAAQNAEDEYLVPFINVPPVLNTIPLPPPPPPGRFIPLDNEK